jgi:uncharacterized membrane protein
MLELQHLWDRLRFSYWFVPSLMSVGAIFLAALTLYLDTREGLDWARWVPWLFVDQPAGARTLLSTIAGSMITVAGVTFSITIAALAYATSQFGPRLLTNFMEDRGNQITLGTFIATFLYSLIVLRSVRAAGEAAPRASGEGDAFTGSPSGGAELPGQVDADLLDAFVPHFSILTALALAVGSVGVLVYYIHHAPSSIHASNVAARIGRDLISKLGQLFPEEIGVDQKGAETGDGEREHTTPPEPPPDAVLPERFGQEAAEVRSGGDGYVQRIDGSRLLALAREHDVVVRLLVHPGAFTWEGRPLAAVWPPQNASPELLARLPKTFVTASKRNATQDVMFLVDELVEVAARALSPGVNDPVTAMTCLDWLSAAAARLGRRAMPSGYRYDGDGALRIIADPVTYGGYAEAAFGRLRPYVETDANAASHMMDRLGELAAHALPERQRVLLRYADDLLHGVRAHHPHPRTLDALETARKAVTQATL